MSRLDEIREKHTEMEYGDFARLGRHNLRPDISAADVDAIFAEVDRLTAALRAVQASVRQSDEDPCNDSLNRDLLVKLGELADEALAAGRPGDRED